MNPEELMRRAGVWRAGELSAAVGLPSGFAALDALLPGGGWPRAGLTEILSSATGIGALSLVLPALARLSAAGHWIVWVAPPHVPYSPALRAHGIELARMLVVELPEQSAAGDAGEQVLWAYEQALRFNDCAAALLWLERASRLALRRLQLAAEAGRTWGIVFRPRQYVDEASPAPFRLVLEAAEATARGDQDRLRVTLHKARGGRGGGQCELALG